MTQDVDSPITDRLLVRMFLDLVESVQDTQEQLIELIGDLHKDVKAQGVSRSFPATKRTDELKPGDIVWWPWVEGDPITATLDTVTKCRGASDDCWFVKTTCTTHCRSIHAVSDETWDLATPGERMGFE